MDSDIIIEIGIDSEDCLYVKPKSKTFEHISDENSDIAWNSDLEVLNSPKPIEWSYVMWFNQIIKTTKSLDCILEIDDNTKWVNISDDWKREIKIMANNQSR